MLFSNTGRHLKGHLIASFVALFLLSFILWALTTGGNLEQQPDAKLRSLLPDTKTPSFISWLKQHGISNKRIPIITIGDARYLTAIHHLKRRLDEWDYGGDFVVLCLDQACVGDESINGWPVLLDHTTDTMGQVAEKKVGKPHELEFSTLLTIR
jgi:hypothetical protein